MKIKATPFHKSCFMSDFDLESERKECFFCNSIDIEKVYKLQENPNIYLMRCKNCEAFSASRVPKEKELKKYYAHYYDDSSFDKKITFDNTEFFANHLYKNFKKYTQKKYLKILDFGGGDGTLAYKLALKFFSKDIKKIDIDVFDYNEMLIESDDKRIRIKRVDQICEFYDIVIASAIIEHLSNPKKSLDMIMDLINDKGLIYIRTPYVVPLLKISNFFNVSYDFTYPAHLHDLGQEFWENFFTKNNRFKIVKSRPSIVETNFRRYFLRTILAYILKFPWFLLRWKYKIVGGWEIFAQKIEK